VATLLAVASVATAAAAAVTVAVACGRTPRILCGDTHVTVSGAQDAADERFGAHGHADRRRRRHRRRSNVVRSPVATVVTGK